MKLAIFSKEQNGPLWKNVEKFLWYISQIGQGGVKTTEAATWRLHNPLGSTSYTTLVRVAPQLTINYSYVEFFLHMERLPQYYLFTVGLPSTLITILAFLCFWLPADCGEKLSFVVSLMLGMTVFQFVIADTLPETSRTKQPLLSAFLLINLVIVGVTVLLILVTVTIHSSRCRIQNQRVRTFLVGILPSLLCVNTVSLSNGNDYDDASFENENLQFIDDTAPPDTANSSPNHQLENGATNNGKNGKPGRRALTQKENRKQRRNSSGSGQLVRSVWIVL